MADLAVPLNILFKYSAPKFKIMKKNIKNEEQTIQNILQCIMN